MKFVSKRKRVKKSRRLHKWKWEQLISSVGRNPWLLSELRVTQFIKINQGYYFKNKLTIYTRSCSINRINTKNQKRLDFILKLHNEGYSNVEITNFLKLFGFKRRNKKDDYKVNDVWVCLKKLKLREERKKDTRMYWGDFEIWKIK